MSGCGLPEMGVAYDNEVVMKYRLLFLLRRHLRETLTIANSNDLNKLTACSLLLLGRIFLSLGNLKVCHAHFDITCHTHISHY